MAEKVYSKTDKVKLSSLALSLQTVMKAWFLNEH